MLNPQPTNFPGPQVALLRERPYYESSVAKKKAASQLAKMRRLDQLFLMDQLSIPPLPPLPKLSSTLVPLLVHTIQKHSTYVPIQAKCSCVLAIQ